MTTIKTDALDFGPSGGLDDYDDLEDLQDLEELQETQEGEEEEYLEETESKTSNEEKSAGVEEQIVSVTEIQGIQDRSHQ